MKDLKAVLMAAAFLTVVMGMMAASALLSDYVGRAYGVQIPAVAMGLPIAMLAVSAFALIKKM